MTGIILLNKPRGLSSNTAVNVVKKSVGALKAGHLGTLDVEAQGLLPITINSSTKLFDYFLNKDKEYLTTFKFGEQTDTFDLEGEITKTEDVNITETEVKSALPAFQGKILQMPPEYSAKKINGKKAYELKREGKEVSLKSKEVYIYKFNLVKQTDKNTFLFRLHCSSGTYVRALCRDLAAALSTCGVCYDITRTKCGQFDLKDAFTLEEIKNGKFNLISPDTLFEYDKIFLDNQAEAKLLNGQFLKSQNPDGKYRIYGSAFMGVGEVKNGLLKLTLRLK